MKVAVAGASGLVGAALVDTLRAVGDTPVPMVRGETADAGEIPWNPATGQLDASDLTGLDAVVCLSGENIASGRWTPDKKAAIRSSRVDAVGLIADRLAGMENPPKTLVCSSAVGYYGKDSGDEIQTEDSRPGNDFLADICVAWEAAAAPARENGIRTVHLRTGVVLAKEGGALKTMVTPFRFGLGGMIGNGRQYMSWLTLDELVNIIRFVITAPSVEGPVNATTPEPVTNREFTRALGKALHRPTLAPLPAPVVRTVLGEMGEALLLSSIRAVPEKLKHAEYTFLHSNLADALAHVLESD